MNKKAIQQAVADIFLSKGSYDDLERLANGSAPHDDVIFWQPFEYGWSYEDILEQVDTAVNNIINSQSTKTLGCDNNA